MLTEEDIFRINYYIFSDIVLLRPRKGIPKTSVESRLHRLFFNRLLDKESVQMTAVDIKSLDGRYEDYLRDESRYVGYAESISFPRSEEEVREILELMNQQGTRVTVQGARTGIVAGAVPRDGHILNLSKMNRITGLRLDHSGGFFLTVEPGVLLSHIREALSRKDFDTSQWSEGSLETLRAFEQAGDWFFPPDPTETSASIGGMVACDASGARSFRYGPTRKYVEGMRVVLANGATVSLKRGQWKTNRRLFNIRLDTGTVIRGSVPSYSMPQVKNAAGYYAADDMDLVDLFAGSEGTLGVITEIELRLLPSPPVIWGMTSFFPSEDHAIEFVRGIRGESVQSTGRVIAAKPVAIEYFNEGALNLLREQKENSAAFAGIPQIPGGYSTAIYVEYHGTTEADVIDMVTAASEILHACGGDESATWMGTTNTQLERLRLFRHAVPEAVNLLIDLRRTENPGLRKLGTDMAVPGSELKQVIDMYNHGLTEAGLDYVMFGHIGDNHIHVNILPRNQEDYNAGKQLYMDWARQIIKLGGTVAAEHGIGKSKVALLREMFGEKGIQEMAAVKRLFDPRGLLNSENLFKQS